MIKKYILLIVITLFISSCYNYVEINNLVIISGIGIDYKDNEYKVSFETLYQDKNKPDSNYEKGIIKKSSGKTLADALENISLVLEKEPYFAHLKVLVISKDIANNHLSELCDYFLRNNDIRNIFSVVISDGSSPEEILSLSDDFYPVASEKIISLLESNTYSSYITKNKYFKNIASNYLSKEKNISLSSIKIIDNDLSLGDIIIFNDNKIVGSLNNDLSMALSLIDNNTTKALYTINCDKEKKITIKVYNSKTSYDFKDSFFVINNNLNAEIVENSCLIDSNNNQKMSKITKEFENLINNKMKLLINYLKENNSDILGINNKYYIKTRKKDNGYFLNNNYSVNTKIKINKNGLIFEVKDDNN